ncbi:MAG: hypothetical protein ACI8TE_001111 [Francisella sp.]|jgi:hypothetical protein
MSHEGTSLSDNIAFISKSEDAPTDDDGSIYKVSKQATELIQGDIKHIVEWMSKHDSETIFVTYFASNFHDTQYHRGMETIVDHVKGLSFDRDITKWNQDNIRLLMFLVANNQANMAPTRYDALEKFKSYIYEVPANVKNNTTYWKVGPYTGTSELSVLITNVFNYPQLHTRVLQDFDAKVDYSEYSSKLK